MNFNKLSAMFRDKRDMYETGQREYDPMLDTSNPKRIARVEQLRQFYDTFGSQEISPFDED